jgi:formate dehydrogenase major subunit
MNGLFCQGLNILLAGPNKTKVASGLAKLKWMVIIDPLQTETARFWENHGEFNNVDPKAIQTEVIQLPTSTYAEEEGSATNSSRVIMWHWKAVDGPGESKSDIEIISLLRNKLAALYAKDGGAFPDPIVNTTWDYKKPENPDPAEVLKEINGYALEDLPDPADPNKVLLAAGKLLPSFLLMRADGKTAGGMWIYTGVYTEAGNNSMRRDASDPTGRGIYPNWGFSWPANRRVLYNRASADPAGKPWSERKKYMYWDGSKWTGGDVPDYGPTVAPDKNVGPFIMNQEGTARLFARAAMPDGPFPEHYEPMDAYIANPLHPKVSTNPAVRVFAADAKSFGTPDKFPIVATSYRLAEHFHYWTKNVHDNAVLQPEMFVEIGERLAKAKGIADGDWVEISSQRGAIKAKACVTKRIRPIMVDGKPCDMVGLPIHYGFVGLTRKSQPVNTLTPPVGDASAQTPEYKAFLVDVKKTTPPASQPATV